MQTLKQKRALLLNTRKRISTGIISGNKTELDEKIRRIDNLLEKMQRLNQRIQEA